jgi:hypothetical protein
MIAVAKIHFPEMGDDYLALIADLAGLSENYLQTVEAVAKLARHFARQEGHRRITVSDIEAAASEVIPRRAVLAPDSTLGTVRKPGVLRTPARVIQRSLKAPFKSPARQVQPGRMQPIGEARPMPFSARGAGLERVESDLVQAEA